MKVNKCSYCNEKLEQGESVFAGSSYDPERGYYHLACLRKYEKEKIMKVKTLQVDCKLMHKFYEDNKDCETVKKFCETLWPDEFKVKKEEEGWEDITLLINWGADTRDSGYHCISGTYQGKALAYISASEGVRLYCGLEKQYAVKYLNDHFRILKRKEEK